MEEVITTKGRKTILVIDDSPLNLQLAAHTLSADYELILVNSGEKGVRIAIEKEPDLILLDVMMPEMSGLEVCVKLKDTIGVKEIPVIFVTAKTQEEDIIHGYDAGGVDYVMKPFRAKELLTRVKTQLAIKEHQNKIEQMNVYLNEVNKNRDKLFSIISHDLRGNADRIDSLTEIIMNSPDYDDLSPELKKPIDMLGNSSKRNKRLVDDLLLWARNQFDQIKFKPIQINLENIIDQVETQMNGALKAKHIKLNKQIYEDLNLLADKDMLTVLFRNLLSNAIKFSHTKGEIIIKCWQQKKKDLITIEIIDQGVGISEDDLNKLFDKKINFSTYGTNGEKGTGLGLELCTDFVSKHNGSIKAESELGKGSTFRIVLPVIQEMEQQP
jgi:two-component system, sensor histidine kinase and response regulator